MASHLGSFGAAIQELEPDGDKDTFDFFGEKFTVEGVVPGILELKISAGLTGQLTGVQGDASVYEALQYALTTPERVADDGNTKVPADGSQWERFYALAVTRKAHTQDLVLLALGILGSQAGRPTVQRSTSADGSLPTSTSSSSSASDSPDSPRLVPVDQLLDG